MSNILPCFSSTYSLGSSILTLDEPSKQKDNGPKSIIKICKDNGLDRVYLIDTSFAGFVSAYKRCQENDLQLCPGLKITLCNNVNDKSEESYLTESKIVIWLNNSQGYESFIKIYTEAATTNFYGKPRVDCDVLGKMWNSESLSLSIPFYSSFLHKNLLYGHNCMPDFFFAEPSLFIENNDLPFNYLIEGAINKWNEHQGREIIKMKSIYYEKEKDFLYYLAMRCIHNRSCLNKPEVPNLASHQFSFESWQKENV